MDQRDQPVRPSLVAGETGIHLARHFPEPLPLLALRHFFGAIVAVQILFSSASAVQMAGVVALSLVQIATALGLAALTVYKLAD